jgi:hypothetical protein
MSTTPPKKSAPMSDSATEIPNVKQRLLNGWIAKRTKKLDSIHISDLIHCRRRVEFTRTDENPPMPDEKNVTSSACAAIETVFRIRDKYNYKEK